MASSSKRRSSSRKQSKTGKARVIATKRKDALPRTVSLSASRRKPVVLPTIEALTEPLATAVAAPKKKAHRLHRKAATASRKKATRAAGRAPAKLDEPAAKDVTQAVAVVVPETVEVAAPAPAGEEFRPGEAEVRALIAHAIELSMARARERAAETVVAVEPPATAYELFAVTALEAPEVEATAVVETELELEVEPSAIVEELPVGAVTAPRIAIGPPPIPEESRAAPPLDPSTAALLALPALAPSHERRSRPPAISMLLSTLSRWTGVSGTE
jgi:hypothetical protein